MFTLDQWKRAIDGELTADDTAQIVGCVTQYARGMGEIKLDQAFEVVGPSGCDPWHKRLKRKERNQAIRALGERLRPRCNISEQADAVRAEIRKYESTWQRRDQHLESPPADPIEHLLFVIFRAGNGSIPTSPKRLEEILAAPSP
jgi:hypothetical protein